jgi:hypothetical protein
MPRRFAQRPFPSMMMAMCPGTGRRRTCSSVGVLAAAVDFIEREAWGADRRMRAPMERGSPAARRDAKVPDGRRRVLTPEAQTSMTSACFLWKISSSTAT